MEEPPPRSDRDRRQRSKFADAARAADLGFRFVGTSVLFAGGGFWADRKAGFAFPIFTLVGLFVGLAAGMLLLVRGVGGGSGPRSNDGDGAPG